MVWNSFEKICTYNIIYTICTKPWNDREDNLNRKRNTHGML